MAIHPYPPSRSDHRATLCFDVLARGHAGGRWRVMNRAVVILLGCIWDCAGATTAGEPAIGQSTSKVEFWVLAVCARRECSAERRLGPTRWAGERACRMSSKLAARSEPRGHELVLPRGLAPPRLLGEEHNACPSCRPPPHRLLLVQPPRRRRTPNSTGVRVRACVHAYVWKRARRQ